MPGEAVGSCRAVYARAGRLRVAQEGGSPAGLSNQPGGVRRRGCDPGWVAPETGRKPPLRELRPGRRVAAMFQPNPPAAFACRPDESRGRDLAEPESPTRSCFQRDRDRIVHAGAFRRLKYKTQVFVYHEGDY